MRVGQYIEFYGKMARENGLEPIGETDEEFKAFGASITDVPWTRCSENQCISQGSLMYSYKPSKQDPRIKTIFGLIKDDHINTLNQDFKALRRTLGMNKEYTTH